MVEKHPYLNLPPENFWRGMVAGVPPAEVDPVVSVAFRLNRKSKIATAGSCFAQHIARHLRTSGFDFLVTERAHPIFSEELASIFGYGVYPARFGNIYTVEQLLQLLLRAYGVFHPKQEFWLDREGNYIDPFRPQIQPGGFASKPEYEADRRQHLMAVRQMVERMDVFIFTLGLTEAWRSREDGAVYPVCPGVSGGEFDSSRHEFHNFSVSEVVNSMRKAIEFIRIRNPEVRVILTVSPVPLVATMAQEGVLQATTYSKAVLRVASSELARTLPDVAYFPSFEVITGCFNRGAYFGPNLRDITEAGVAHVMRLFSKHYLDTSGASECDVTSSPIDEHTTRMEQIVQVACEEEALQSAATIEQ
ncbi:MAG: GSCFA domain-containing protein [Alphaproteobacteria bacterium]|nr:GSCFA domain-containing protein [Alphaproteobacteria bacterium]